MKTYIIILTVLVAALYACNTPQAASSKKYNDDIYYSSGDAAADRERYRKEAELARQERDEQEKQRAEQEKQRAQQANNQSQNTTDDYYSPDTRKSNANNYTTTQTTTNSDGGVTNITNNYYDRPFNYDDYYDNEYAARLRRFNNPIGNYGYYDNYYTNSYWYTGNPYNYGTSIYLGYNFWGPTYTAFSYNPSYYWYSNAGWGYDPWYNPYNYYNPCYGYGGYWGSYGGYGGYYGSSYYGYNPYMSYGYGGYNQGYYNGYNNGYNAGSFANNYFNSYDNNSYYYGPRGTTSSNSRTTAQPTLAHRYIAAVETETQKPFEETKGRTNNPYLDKVNDSKVNTHNRIDNYTKPVGPVNPDYKPAADKYDSREDRPVPVNANPKPTENNIYNNRPAENKPVYETKPYTQPSKYETPQYNHEQPQQKIEQSQPKSEQAKPRNEQPKFEQAQPRYEQPQNNTMQQQVPSTPAPRGNSNPEPRPRR